MTIAALTWPEAIVGATSVAAIALVLSILIWSIFRTGQTAIRNEGGERELVERLRQEVAELRVKLEQPAPASGTEPGA